MREVWAELSATMRALRRNAGVSLRQAEVGSGWGRGFLSQIENEKSRPNRSIVEWYDATFGGNGMLMALFAEARTAHESPPAAGPAPAHAETGDAFEIEQNVVAAGQRVAAGETLQAGWKLINTGTVDWIGRALRRVGATAGPRVLGSPLSTSVPDCAAGGIVDVGVAVTAPQHGGTVVAYFEMVDAQGRSSFVPARLLSIVVVVA